MRRPNWSNSCRKLLSLNHNSEEEVEEDSNIVDSVEILDSEAEDVVQDMEDNMVDNMEDSIEDKVIPDKGSPVSFAVQLDIT